MKPERMRLAKVTAILGLLAATAWALVGLEFALGAGLDILAVGTAVAFTACALAVPFLREARALRQGLIVALLCQECGGHVVPLTPRRPAFCLSCGAFPKLRPASMRPTTTG